jgi:hypothetical protein
MCAPSSDKTSFSAGDLNPCLWSLSSERKTALITKECTLLCQLAMELEDIRDILLQSYYKASRDRPLTVPSRGKERNRLGINHDALVNVNPVLPGHIRDDHSWQISIAY